jgi:DNA-binding NtrC family response regulator
MNSQERVLIVDDEPDMVENVARILRHVGYRCLRVTEAERALALLESERPDLLITDLRMPGIDGMDLLHAARGLDPPVPVIVITAFATVESAVTAIKQGAFDFLPKTFSVDQLVVVVERALRQRALQRENWNLRDQLRGTLETGNIIGRSPEMARVLDLVQKAARSEANILIMGESGTGKELIAQAVHANSARAGQPFVPVDCASLPEHLLESELFGHEKGAFTGAIRTKPGLMELAQHGTLLLDEIAELPLALQVKLLRALQERQIRRVGATGLVDVDVRVVSATNRHLRDAVVKGQFREELYYRVNVIEIRLPPLRERAGDVALLAHTFLKRFGESRGFRFSDEALAALERYRWPGNIRELQNVVERACALAEGETIELSDLPEYLPHGYPFQVETSDDLSAIEPRPPSGVELPLRQAKEQWMRALEGSYLREVLGRHGTVSAAARAAGVDRKTFHRLLNKYRTEEPGTTWPHGECAVSE